MAAGRQFVLLLWKNWLLQKRKVILTIFEIAVPALFALVLVFIRQRVTATDYPAPHVWKRFSVDNFNEIVLSPLPMTPILSDPRWGLAFAPNTPIVQRIARRAATRLYMKTTGNLLINLISIDNNTFFLDQEYTENSYLL